MALEDLHDPVTKLNDDARSCPIIQAEGRYGFNRHHCNTSCCNRQPPERGYAYLEIRILAHWKHKHSDQNSLMGIVAR